MRTIEDISVCVKSDVGLKRTKNEDSHQLVYQNEAGCNVDSFGRMFAVADGWIVQVGVSDKVSDGYFSVRHGGRPSSSN